MTLLDLLPYALKRAASTNGGEYAGPCPSCGGRDRFRVWPAPTEGRPRFWCRGCGAHGDAIDLVRLVQPSLSFQEARRVAGENTPLDCAPPAQRRELPIFGERLIESYARHPERYARWLAYRGLRPETVDEFRLGYGTLPGEQFRTPGLIVPVFDGKGRCRTLRCRTADTWLTAGGCTLYAPCGLPVGAVVMVVENCANACLIAQAAPHITPVALTTGAASWDERWPGWIAKREPALVIVAGDDDEAGQRMNERWKLALEIAGVPVTTETINESIEMEWRDA